MIYWQCYKVSTMTTKIYVFSCPIIFLPCPLWYLKHITLTSLSMQKDLKSFLFLQGTGLLTQTTICHFRPSSDFDHWQAQQSLIIFSLSYLSSFIQRLIVGHMGTLMGPGAKLPTYYLFSKLGNCFVRGHQKRIVNFLLKKPLLKLVIGQNSLENNPFSVLFFWMKKYKRKQNNFASPARDSC